MRYYFLKEGVVMAEALGQELLIDLYSCEEAAILRDKIKNLEVIIDGDNE